MGENKGLRLITTEGTAREYPSGTLDSFRVINSLLFMKKGDDCIAIYNMNYILCVERI